MCIRDSFHSVHILEGADIGDIGQACQHALAVFVAQARFNAKLLSLIHIQMCIRDRPYKDRKL